MAATQVSPIFALPLELRTKIYEELLCPNPTRVHTLYHDRQGREPSFNINPAILCVCTLAYDEAVSLLYCNNIFEIYLATSVVQQCTGGTYPDSTPDPPPLLLKHAATVEPAGSQYDLLPTRSSARAPIPYVELGSQGIIYIHCFQRLQPIRLVTSRGAIWGDSEGGLFFSSPGELILEILNDLIGEAPTPARKHLEFIVQPDWLTKYGIFQSGTTDAEDGKAIEMVALLQKIKKIRAVKLEEKVFSDELGSLETRQVDIDAFIKDLDGRFPWSS